MINRTFRWSFPLLLSATAMTFVGCVNQPNVDVVDLNKVLDAFASVVEETQKTESIASGAENATNITATVKSSADATQAPPAATTAATTGSKMASQSGNFAIDPSRDAEFLTRFAAKLNEVQAMQSTVGVAMTTSGQIVGFKDFNGDNVQDSGETKEFTLTLDPENNRVVASDNNGHHRPYGFTPGGFMMGYMLSSMLGRQSSFFSGPNASAKPDFSKTQMSSQDYHKSAVQSARSAARPASSPTSARSRSGSRGFSFGK